MNKLLVMILASSLLLLTGRIAGAQTARARIADTPIRAEANLASAIIATLKEGSPVDVVDVQGDWYRVLVPNDRGKPRVGYVLAHLIEIVNTDGSQAIPAPASGAARSLAQGPPIPPTFAQLPPQRDQTTARERALKANVDAMQVELDALQRDQPAGQIQAGQIPQPLAQHPQAREGLWFNAGLGLGSLSCNGCDATLSGLSGGLSLGGRINDRLLVGVGTTGYYKSENGSALSVGTLDARLRFYPVLTSGFFLTGGVGLGTITAGVVGFGTQTESGVGVVLGLGWDIPIRSNLSLTPFWNGVGVRTSDANASIGQLGLGITLHRADK
jgi:hypothetical protein